jgi:Secretion system C-terminal sorting domain
MKHIKSFLCLLLLSVLCIVIQAQITIPATGGNATGSTGSISYTVGQIAYQTISGTNGVLTQGVQQPYEISVVTAVKNTEEITIKCLVYPNPTRGLTKLVFESPDFENVRLLLYDFNGVLLSDKKVESKEIEISLENFSSSVYFLKVIKDNQEVKVFKIVKK